jgi:CheY-like chemotaxis protein
MANISSKSFLVVDDEPFIQMLAVRVLKQIGATAIDTAGNGVEALAYLDAAETPPDVMLVDLAMPEMGGAELLRHLAERGYTGAVVMVSGADEETLSIAEGLAKFRELNVLGHITKPLTQPPLEEMLGGLE